MENKEDNKKAMSEYKWFKNHEKEYLDDQSINYQLNGKKGGDWLYWLVALILVVFFVGFTAKWISQSAGEVVESQSLNRLTAKEAVEQMYEGEWIRRDLGEEEYEIVEIKVKDLEESSEKVHIKVRLDEAREQLSSQEKAKYLVNELKGDNGEANIDLERSVLDKGVEDFPSNYQPEFAQELELEYTDLLEVIREAFDLQDSIVEMNEDSSKYIDGGKLSSLITRVKNLPESERKERLSNDILALEDIYEKQQEEIRIKEAEERKRREAEEERRKQTEAEKERQRQKDLEEERKRQERIEEERKQKEEQERIEREKREEFQREQERLEQEVKENQDQEINNNGSNNNSGNRDEEVDSDKESNKDKDKDKDESRGTNGGNE